MSKKRRDKHIDHKPESDAKHHEGEEKSTNRHVYVEPGVQIDFVKALRDQYNATQTEKKTGQRKQLFWTKVAAGLIFVYTVISGFQWYEMHKSLVIDQRAWVSIPFPANYPLDEPFIPATTQITNSGKTPARNVEVSIVATVLSRGEKPDLTHFGPGRAYNRVYAGAIFANVPIPLTIPVVHYGPLSEDIIVPDETLRQDIASGKRFISFYGRVTYSDVLGVQHWTQFCTGYGSAISESLKDCIKYNDVDTNKY